MCNGCRDLDDSTLIIQMYDRVAVIANQEYPIDDAKALVVAIKQQRQTNKELTKVSVQPSLDTRHTDVVKLMDAIHECSFRKVKFLDAK
ncbi:MAG: hypothetical protein K2X29_04705 [Candidatus Obscuribacterales bacterium]|nr:hypothetical protein [Candidatus Obscuribacterales bacterium]